MSKFKAIETEFRNSFSLEKALEECGVSFSKSADVKNPSLTMHGYQGDARPERASYLIDRKFVNKHWGTGCSNDVGFAWNGKTFDAVVSNYDQGRGGVTKAMNQIKQRYARAEIVRQAKMKGYFVNEKTQADGTIRLQMVRR